MLTEFDKFVKQRKQLQAWRKLSTTIRGWGGGYHVLRVDVPKPTMVAYCGQAYAGATNYHDAPDFFAEAIRSEIESRMQEIVDAAYAKEIVRLGDLIERNRSAVMKELAEAEVAV